jgi:hypothetical protein
MSEIILPSRTEAADVGVDHKVVGRYDFSDGSTVLDVTQGSIHQGYVVINPDNEPQHPPTNEQPLVRRIMRELFQVAATHVFYTGGPPEDVTIGELYKNDHFHDYAQTTRFLIREGLLPDDHIVGCEYE